MKGLDDLRVDGQLKGFLKVAGVLAVVLFAIIPIQVAVFFVFPPPQTVLDFFALYHRNWFVGLLDLDLNLTIDNLAFVLVYICLFLLLKKDHVVLVTVGLVLAGISLVLYIVSRESLFTMVSLSDQYFSGATSVDKNALIAAGTTLLAIYNGTSFDVSYVLGGVALGLFSIAMLKSPYFTKTLGVIGIVDAVFMLVPPTAGTFGLVMSFLSLLPLMPWLFLLAVRLFQLAKMSRD